MVNSEAIKILLIDDDEEDYLITRDLLEDTLLENFQLTWLDGFERGKEAILKNEHDVYLVDYRLGAETGLDLIKVGLKIPVDGPMILMTGQGDKDTDTEALNLGASDYLIKGRFDADQLERSIRYGLQRAGDLIEIRKLNTELEGRVEQRTRELKVANNHLKEQIKKNKETEEALRDSQRFYSIIAKNFPNGTINVFDTDLNYVFVEGKELNDMGIQSEDLIGTNYLQRVPKGVSAEIKEHLQKVFKGENRSFDISFDGQIYVLNAVPLIAEKGRVKQILVVEKNMTDQKKAEMEVRNALKKERELNEMKSRFVSMASHEFRTPLSTVLSSVSLISRYTENHPKEEKIVKHVDRIKNSVKNLTGILNDFLSLGKLEEGRVEINLKDVNLLSIIKDIKEDMVESLKPGQSIKIACAEDQELKSDPHILKNILYNLISNASKYSQEEKPIHILVKDEGTKIMLEVKDKGIGIPEKEQQHMFERFFRAGNVTNIQGTGLGLNIVKKYVELLDGEISFNSIPEEGTTFRIILAKK